MRKSLSILIVEDSENDMELIIRQFRKADYDITYERVETARQMTAAILKKSWDLVIADYSLPQFNAPSALAILQKLDLDIPFVVVSGTIGEETAIRIMKAGAQDYIMKDNLSRLVPAIERELKESESRMQRKRAEEELSKSEKKYRELYDFLPIPVYEMDFEATLTSANQALYETFRASEEDLRKDARAWQLLSPEDIDKSRKNIERLLKGEHIGGTEYNLKRLDGSAFPAIVISSVIYSNGKPVGIRGAIVDITEQTQQEEKLRRANVFLDSIVENIPNMLFLKDALELRFVRFNRAGEDLLGYSKEDLLGKSDYDFFSKEQADFFTEKDREVLRGKEVVDIPEEPLQTRNRGERTLHTKKVPILNAGGESEYLLGISEDITDRKRVENDLHRSEERYRSVLEDIDEGFFELDLAGNFTFVNDAECRDLRYSREELIGMNYRQYSDEATAKNLYELFNNIYKTGKPIKRLPEQFISKDGTHHFNEVSASLIRDPKGKPVGFRGISQDVTERKRAEEEIKQSFVRMRKALSATVHAISMVVELKDPYTSGHQRRVADLSRSIAREMGLSADRQDFIRTSTTIHDIGKIAIPTEILSKPTKLTDLEFDLIKTHARSGYDILKNIDFPWPVADVVLQHHERMDGSGYPNGLKGNAILLEARILAVSDVVESMASHRPYRAALGIETALEEIRKNKGILYDADVVDACLKLFKEKGYRMP